MKNSLLALALSTTAVASTASAVSINFAGLNDASFAAAPSLQATIGVFNIVGTTPNSGTFPEGEVIPRLGIAVSEGNASGLGVIPEQAGGFGLAPEVEPGQTVTFSLNSSPSTRGFTSVTLASVGTGDAGRITFSDSSLSPIYYSGSEASVGILEINFADPVLGSFTLDSITGGGVTVSSIVATPLPASAWGMLLIGSAASLAEMKRRRRLQQG